MRRGLLGGSGTSYEWSAPLAKSDLDGDGVADSNPNGLTYTVTQDGDALEVTIEGDGVTVPDGYQEGLRFDVGGSVTTWWDPSDWKGDGNEAIVTLMEEVSPSTNFADQVLCVVGPISSQNPSSGVGSGMAWTDVGGTCRRFPVIMGAGARTYQNTSTNGRYTRALFTMTGSGTSWRCNCTTQLLDADYQNLNWSYNGGMNQEDDWSSSQVELFLGVGYWSANSNSHAFSVRIYVQRPILAYHSGEAP
jgi:hypothetical protein